MEYFNTKEQVASYLRGLKSSHSSEANYLESEKIFGTRLEALKTLKSELVKEENLFFKRILGKGNNLSPKESLIEIQNKIDDWNKSGAENLFNDKITEIILEIMNNFFGISLEELAKAFVDNILVTDIVPELALNSSSLKEDLVDGINKILTSNKKTNFSKKVLMEKFELRSNNKGNFYIDFMPSSESKMSPNYIRRLIDIYNSTVKEEKKLETKTSLAERINWTLTKNGISGEPLKYITKEIKEHISEYALHYNFAVIKGFLGEVYWVSFFKFLTGDNSAKPTGDIKNTKKQSISIDMLFENFGFQIKNYKIKNGKVNLGLKDKQHRLVGNFILDRAEVTPSEALLLFFGAWGYNRPILNASEEYKDLYNSFNSHFGEVDKIFQLHVDKIIGVDKIFQQQINEEGKQIEILFPEEKTYFNNFFLINDKIVPSSEIIQGIIEGFEKEEARVKFKGEYTLRQDISEEKLYPKGEPKSLREAANLVLINYQVHIDIKDILNKAYSNF